MATEQLYRRGQDGIMEKAVPEARGKAAAFDTWLAQGGGTFKHSGKFRTGPMKGLTYDQAKQRFEAKWATVGDGVKEKYAGRAKTDLAPSEQIQGIEPTPSARSNAQPGVAQSGANPAKKDMSAAGMQKRRMASYGHEFNKDGVAVPIGTKSNTVPSFKALPPGQSKIVQGPPAPTASATVGTPSPKPKAPANNVNIGTPEEQARVQAELERTSGLNTADNGGSVSNRAAAVASKPNGQATPPAKAPFVPYDVSKIQLAQSDKNLIEDHLVGGGRGIAAARNADYHNINVPGKPADPFTATPAARSTTATPVATSQKPGVPNIQLSPADALDVEHYTPGTGNLMQRSAAAIAGSVTGFGNPPNAPANPLVKDTSVGVPSPPPKPSDTAQFPSSTRAQNIAAAGGDVSKLATDDRMVVQGKINGGPTPVVKAPSQSSDPNPMQPNPPVKTLIPGVQPAPINRLTGLPMGYRPGDKVEAPQQANADASVARQIAADPRMQPGSSDIVQGPSNKPMTGSVPVAGAPRAIPVIEPSRPNSPASTPVTPPPTAIAGVTPSPAAKVRAMSNEELEKAAGRKFFTGKVKPLGQASAYQNANPT